MLTKLCERVASGIVLAAGWVIGSSENLIPRTPFLSCVGRAVTPRCFLELFFFIAKPTSSWWWPEDLHRLVFRRWLMCRAFQRNDLMLCWNTKTNISWSLARDVYLNVTKFVNISNKRLRPPCHAFGSHELREKTKSDGTFLHCNTVLSVFSHTRISFFIVSIWFMQGWSSEGFFPPEKGAVLGHVWKFSRKANYSRTQWWKASFMVFLTFLLYYTDVHIVHIYT